MLELIIEKIKKGGEIMPAMSIWCLFLALVTILSYLADLGLITFFDIRVPNLNASLLSVLLALIVIGMLGRILQMIRRGEKEKLQKQIEKIKAKK